MFEMYCMLYNIYMRCFFYKIDACIVLHAVQYLHEVFIWWNRCNNEVFYKIDVCIVVHAVQYLYEVFYKIDVWDVLHAVQYLHAVFYNIVVTKLSSFGYISYFSDWESLGRNIWMLDVPHVYSKRIIITDHYMSSLVMFVKVTVHHFRKIKGCLVVIIGTTFHLPKMS